MATTSTSRFTGGVAPRSSTARTVFRVLGFVFVAAGLVFAISGFVWLFQQFGSDEMPDGIGRFWMVFVGFPLLAIGAGCLQAGFVGVASRYAAGEVSGAVRETGMAWRGETSSTGSSTKTGKFCSECGVRNDEGAKFCDACGDSLR